MKGMVEQRAVELAEYIMFSQDKSSEGLDKKLNDLGLEFRKNKGIRDINKAIEKARNPKNGFYRTELEIDMLSVYLKHIKVMLPIYSVKNEHFNLFICNVWDTIYWN